MPSRSTPRRLRRVASATLALALAATATARAAGPWSEPQTVPGGYLAHWESPSGGALQTFPGLLGFTPGGTGLAILGDAGPGQGITRFYGPATAFDALRPMGFGGVAPQLMATYGRGGVMVAGGADLPTDPRSTFNPTVEIDAAVSRGTTSGAFTTRQVLAHGAALKGDTGPIAIQAANVTALAANAAGDAAAVVTVPIAGRAGVRGFRSKLFIRRRGQPRFRAVTEIGKRTYGRSPAALAVNGPGDVLVAWDDRDRVRARVVRAGGKPGAVQTLGPGGSAWVGTSRMAAAMDDARRMLVAWVAQSVGEGGYAGHPGITAYAVARPGESFRPAVTVETGLPQGFNRMVGGVAAVLFRRRAVVAWTGYVDGRFAARAADVGVNGPGVTADLSPPGLDADFAGLAAGPPGETTAGPSGGMVAVWATRGRRHGASAPPLGIYASSRSANGTAWSAPEPIAPTGTGDNVADVPLAIEPAGGRAVVLWSDPLMPTPTIPAQALTTHSSVRVPVSGG